MKLFLIIIYVYVNISKSQFILFTITFLTCELYLNFKFYEINN